MVCKLFSFISVQMMYFVVALFVTFDLLTGAHSQQGND